MLKFEFIFVFLLFFYYLLLLRFFVASEKNHSKTTTDRERTNGAMKAGFFSPHSPVYPLHADKILACGNVSILQTLRHKFCTAQKNGFSEIAEISTFPDISRK